MPTTTLAGFEAAGVGVLFGVLAQLSFLFWLSGMVVAGILSCARLLEVAARWRKGASAILLGPLPVAETPFANQAQATVARQRHHPFSEFILKSSLSGVFHCL